MKSIDHSVQIKNEQFIPVLRDDLIIIVIIITYNNYNKKNNNIIVIKINYDNNITMIMYLTNLIIVTLLHLYGAVYTGYLFIITVISFYYGSYSVKLYFLFDIKNKEKTE